MAKIDQKSNGVTKKQASKAATLKCRTTSFQKEKPVVGVKAKTTANVNTTQKSNVSRKVSKTVVKKSTASKLASVKTVKKRMPQAKTSQLAKQQVSKSKVAKPTTAKKSPKPQTILHQSALLTQQIRCESTKLEHPLDRKLVSTEELRALLLERRSGILKNIDDEIAPVQENKTPMIVGDVVDLAQGSSENEISFHLAEVESRELGQIDKALARISEGTYGVCEKCGERISPARLKALPFANKCIHCQEEDERENY